MRACQVAFAAAIFFGGAADAAASALIAPPSATVLHANSVGIEAARGLEYALSNQSLPARPLASELRHRPAVRDRASE